MSAVEESHRDRARMAKARADLLDLNLRVLRGDFVDQVEAEKRWGDYFANFRNDLLSLAASLSQAAPHLSRGDIAAFDQVLRDRLTIWATASDPSLSADPVKTKRSSRK